MTAVTTHQHTCGKLKRKETRADEIRRPKIKAQSSNENKPTGGKEGDSSGSGSGGAASSPAQQPSELSNRSQRALG